MRNPGLVLAVALAVAAAAGAQERAATQVWQVNADGTAGLLRLAVRRGGELSGTLLGRPVEGRLAGRRIVLRRSAPDGVELWEGWVATPGAEVPTMAGSYVPAGGGAPRPWFAVAAASAAPAGEGAPAPTAPPPAPAPTPPPRPTAVTAAPLLEGRPDLRGVWRTPSGPLEIRQEGARLTFVLPDREVAGRLTGPDTLIGGFAPGCCKGRLEQGFAVIVWDDGTRWYRER